MISVMFVACLITQPLICKEVNLTFLQDIKNITPYQCQHTAGVELIKWAKDHPRYKIARWKCVPENKREFKI